LKILIYAVSLMMFSLQFVNNEISENKADLSSLPAQMKFYELVTT